MPLFKFVGRGTFITAKQGVIQPGETVEMSDADAASLPPGTVAPVGIPVPLVRREPVLTLDSGQVEKPLLLVPPPPSGAVRPTHSHGSKRVKDTKP
jgi:hypothetical protein